LGPANEHESRKLIPLLNDIQIRNNNGRPKSRPERIWADTKYHTFLVLTYLYNRRIRAQIRERSNTKPKQGRPNIFLYQDYKKVRSSVERFFGWLKSFRRIQTRYERLASTYLGFIQLGCIMILMRLFRWVHKKKSLKISCFFVIESLFRTSIGARTTEPVNYTGSYTLENRVIIAGILKKGVNN
jgi:hypothetical protein